MSHAVSHALTRTVHCCCHLQPFLGFWPNNLSGCCIGPALIWLHDLQCCALLDRRWTANIGTTLQDGSICPGVRVEDMGHKMGCNGVDNGKLWFDGEIMPSDWAMQSCL